MVTRTTRRRSSGSRCSPASFWPAAFARSSKARRISGSAGKSFWSSSDRPSRPMNPNGRCSPSLTGPATRSFLITIPKPINSFYPRKRRLHESHRYRYVETDCARSSRHDHPAQRRIDGVARSGRRSPGQVLRCEHRRWRLVRQRQGSRSEACQGSPDKSGHRGISHRVGVAMKFGVVIFPGSNCDHDCYYAVQAVIGKPVELVWHQDTSLKGFDAVILPGGFSYGDYLRTGALAKFSPVMQSVKEFADKGGLVIGICNGFQILTESGLLPGALMRNVTRQYICKFLNISTETTNSPFTNQMTRGQVLRIPIGHGDGNYFADPET